MSKTEALNLLQQEYLGNLKRVAQFHPEIAVGAALFFCIEDQIRPPTWVQEMSCQIHIESISGSKHLSVGRNAKQISRYRQDMFDYERWDAVCTARRMQKEIRHQLEVAKELGAEPSKWLTDRRKMAAWLGHDWNRAYECAAMYLIGSHTFAGVDAIRASYLKVQKRMRTGIEASRHCMIDPAFLKKLGIPFSFERQGTKYIPLYDLTL